MACRRWWLRRRCRRARRPDEVLLVFLDSEWTWASMAPGKMNAAPDGGFRVPRADGPARPRRSCRRPPRHTRSTIRSGRITMPWSIRAKSVMRISDMSPIQAHDTRRGQRRFGDRSQGRINHRQRRAWLRASRARGARAGGEFDIPRRKLSTALPRGKAAEGGLPPSSPAPPAAPTSLGFGA